MHLESRDTAESSPRPQNRVDWLKDHRPFIVALLLAAALRVVVMAAFTPALVFSDGKTYLNFVDSLVPITVRPAGYALLLLYPLSLLTDELVAVVLTQHLMGLVTAGLIYALLRRWGVGRWPATLGTLPVLFDSLQLLLEHSTLSDTLFQFLVVLGVVVLGWRRRPTPVLAFVAGLLLGLSVTVRLVGEPLILAGVAYCLLAGNNWRGRLAGAAALTVGFAVPVTSYATWYHSEHGVYALSEFSTISLYLRTTSFVDCPKLSLPQYQLVLCPAEPLGKRLDPTYYAWHDERTVRRLRPPPGTTMEEALGEFALEAIRQQPVDYARTALRDLMLNFDIQRVDRFELYTARKWQFIRYLDFGGTQPTMDAYEEHGGDYLAAHQPYADAVVQYQRFGYLPGPLLLACVLLGLAGGLGLGQARSSGMRSITLLMTITGVGLLLMPAMTAQFVWRYQLPALALLPTGAALGYTAMRASRRGDGAEATTMGPDRTEASSDPVATAPPVGRPQLEHRRRHL